jgi:two-component system CheB/CheR fusion protein
VIDAIPGQMRQIFQNLVSNALKFTCDGRDPVVNIIGTHMAELDFEGQPDPSGNFIRISVKDNGIGFDEQYANKIFVIFQRLHSRESYEGTGIGLAIAKKIVERHGGIIDARSKSNEGAEFIIVLPIKQGSY